MLINPHDCACPQILRILLNIVRILMRIREPRDGPRSQKNLSMNDIHKPHVAIKALRKPRDGSAAAHYCASSQVAQRI